MPDFDITTKTNQERASKHPLKWIAELALVHKGVATYVVIGIIIHQSLRFMIPVLVGNLVEYGIRPGSLDQVRFYAILVLIVGLISPFFDATMSWGNEYLAASVERDVRSIYFQSLQEKNMAFHDSSKLGELIAIAQNDMRSLYRTLAPGIRVFGEAMVSMTSIAIIIFFQSWILGVIFLLLLPLWYFSLKWYNGRLTPVSISQQDQFRNLSAKVQENLSGAEVVRAFSRENFEINEFEQDNTEYTSIWEQRGKVTALYFPMLVAYAIGGILFLVAAFLATRDSFILFGIQFTAQLNIGAMVTIIGLIIQFRGPTFLLGRVIEFSTLGLAGVRKVQTILAEDSSLDQPSTPVKSDISGQVRYEDVSFGYGEEMVLDNISFEASPGEIVAIVGPTGSGKTTLLKLLTRLYDPTSGSIKIDGVDLRDYAINHLRKSIASVEQDIYLFSTSIRKNITFAVDEEEITEEEIKEVVEVSRADEFVYDLPHGLEQKVGERGMRLSGGQKQRIAIARAFLVDPKILILDDSTSAVDSETEQEIVGAIKEIMKGRTSFIITARLNMIRQADKVLILDKGQLVGEGTHDELLANNTIYRRIFDPHMELPTLEVERK